MKKVLITGVNSYVGNKFAEWIAQYPNDYEVEKISLRNDEWRKMSFSEYDTVLHVAGIAHQKETKKNAHIYYKINRDLSVEIARKSKEDGVTQFIFLSSMSVYGLDEGVIDKNTIPNPTSHYGKSKREAEKLIHKLSDNLFKIAIVRPPMIYGKNCKGNYQRLRKLALKTPVFPNIENERSMIYINNLTKFLRWLVDEFEQNIYCPQNVEYVNTSYLVQLIAKAHGKSVRLTKIFNPILYFIPFSIKKKVFGNLIYAKKSISLYNQDFDNLVISIKQTET